MIQLKCTQCDGPELAEGFLLDRGQGGDSVWVEGAMETGPLGGTRRFGRAKWQVAAYRCARCGHLELFTTARR